MQQYTATIRYLRMTPRKVRAIADIIRGLSANEAEAQLLFANNRRAAKPILKLLRSAVSNAKSQKAAPEKLTIESIRVDQGPMLKRSLPRARGMATEIQKKMSHVTIVLAESDKVNKSRFTIVVPKKTKTKPETPAKPRKEKDGREAEEKTQKPNRPGFFKRMFSRPKRYAK